MQSSARFSADYTQVQWRLGNSSQHSLASIALVPSWTLVGARVALLSLYAKHALNSALRLSNCLGSPRSPGPAWRKPNYWAEFRLWWQTYSSSRRRANSMLLSFGTSFRSWDRRQPSAP